MLVAKEKNCYDYYPFVIIPSDKWLLKPLQLFSASLKKNLRFEIHQKITISVEEALTFNQDWMPTDMSFLSPSEIWISMSSCDP